MGSSPLTRGKPPCATCPRMTAGLIPAHAGKTVSTCSGPHGPGAHPRSRGENAKMRGRRNPGGGSSPLTRGKRCAVEGVPRDGRLIPAHAGKTRARVHSPCGRRAHPRSRGENVRPGAPQHQEGGSSPLTRGKPDNGRVHLHGRGLIPAHAGKTRAQQESATQVRAHPRSRGENGSATRGTRLFQGSSPLTRGKRH